MSTVSRTISYRHVAGPYVGHTSAMQLSWTGQQPYTVHVDFGPGETAWRMWRDVLARRVVGIAQWVASDGYAEGGVAITTAGHWAYLTCSTRSSTITIRFIAADLDAFLRNTEALVPYGAESAAVDAELDNLLKEGTR